MNKEWPKIISYRPPKKHEFKVFDNLEHGGAYKKLRKGQMYNDYMYQEALSSYEKLGEWIKHNDWFDD